MIVPSIYESSLTIDKNQQRQETYVQSDTKKLELLKNPTKMEEIQEKKIIDRN